MILNPTKSELIRYYCRLKKIIFSWDRVSDGSQLRACLHNAYSPIFTEDQQWTPLWSACRQSWWLWTCHDIAASSRPNALPNLRFVYSSPKLLNVLYSSPCCGHRFLAHAVRRTLEVCSFIDHQLRHIGSLAWIGDRQPRQCPLGLQSEWATSLLNASPIRTRPVSIPRKLGKRSLPLYVIFRIRTDPSTTKQSSFFFKHKI